MSHTALVALGGVIFALACGTPDARSAPPPCALDSAALAQTVRGGLARLGIPAPNAETPLELGQHPVRLDGADRVLVTASWGGPSNGAVLWSTCSGEILDGESSGYVLGVERRTRSGQTLFELRSITGTGSGWRQESLQLYSAGADELALVWSGVVSERSYQAASVGAYEEQGELQYLGSDSLVYASTRYPVTMADDGRWVRDGAPVQPTRRVYLWNAGTGKYEARGQQGE